MFIACQQNKDKAPKDNAHDNSTIVQSDSTATEDSINTDNKLIEFTMNDIRASWCGPCRAEMPNLVRLYAEQKDNGLGIIGISLDNDHSNWENAIKKDGITWLQLSDLQGWDNAAARMYNVNSIPHTIVVDANGTIIAEGLRGEELDTFIKQNL